MILRTLTIILAILVSAFTLSNLGNSPTVNIDRITRSVYYVENYYYDPIRILPEKMLKAGLMDIARHIPEVLIDFPEGPSTSFTVWAGNDSTVIKLPPLKKLSDIFTPVTQTLEFVFKHLNEDTKPDDVEAAFIAGMLAKLDPHSDFMTPDMYKEFKTQTEGEYGGLGIVIGMKDDELTVVAPLEGTPAMAAGIKAEDKITQIDDAATINMSLSEAVERMRGKVGAKVTLYIRRKNSDTIEFPLVRQKIIINSVKSKLSTVTGKKVGILRITGFQDDTYSDMLAALEKLQVNSGGKLDGLILDMRNNPGGLLDQSLKMADRFLSSGDLLFTVGANEGDENVVKATAQSTDINLPIVVLINEGSASASEIVAGAFKGNNRALVVGTRSFGKGSVQSLFSLKDGSSLKLTVAQYLTPGRISIQAEGIVPDIDLHPVRLTEEAMDLLEDTRYGEKDLEDHLTSEQTAKNQKPTYIIPYLDGEKTKEESEYTAQVDDKNDFPIVFSLGLLSNNPQLDREQWLKSIEATIKDTSQKQAAKIKAALEAKSIDWSHGEVGAKPLLQVASELSDSSTKTDVSHFEAGKEINWTLTVTNKGPGVIGHLIGVIASDHPLFRDREFVFGKIDVGTSKKATVKIKVPKDTVNFEENLSLKFFSQSGAKLPSAPLSIKMTETPKTLLSYQYDLLDDGQMNSIGNGNGLPEKGETLTLKIRVHNNSAHKTEETLLNIKNLEEEDGIFLKEGRASLGPIEPHSFKEGRLIFQVGQNFPADSLKLKLYIMEKNTRTRLENTLRYSLNPQAPRLEPAPKTLLVPPTLGLTQQEVASDKKSISLSGWAEDEESLTDVMIFANGEKVFYKTPPSQIALAATFKSPKQIAFTTTLPLKEGINIINIMARDNKQISASLDLLVDGPERKESLSEQPVVVP